MNTVRLTAAIVALTAAVFCISTPFADLSFAEGIDNDQGTVTYYTYTVDFQFQGTDAQWILWEFGFDDENGNPVTSDEWNPQGVEFPRKGTYTVVQTVGNTVGTYVSQLVINIMGTPEVSFETNGGSDVPMQTVKVGSKASQPSDPAKDGCTFGGWYKEASMLNRYNFDQPVTQHMTLYAKWISDPGEGGNGGSNGDTDPGNDDGTKDDEKTQTSDAIAFEPSYLIIALGAAVGYLGYRYGSRNGTVAGLVIMAVGVACLLTGFDVLGLLGVSA